MPRVNTSTWAWKLNEVAAGIEKSNGNLLSTPDGIDPWGISGRSKTKPVVVAGHGFCLTLAIELMLASEVRIAAPSAKFAQMEVQRGVFPFGGATLRFHEQCGWGNAMKYMLTGEMFTAAEALRIGLIQEIVELPKLKERALEIAQKIADQSPLAVRATLASAHLSLKEGRAAAAQQLFSRITKNAEERRCRRRHQVVSGKAQGKLSWQVIRLGRRARSPWFLRRCAPALRAAQ